MDANASPAAVLEARLSPVWRVHLSMRDSAADEAPPAGQPQVEQSAPPKLVSGEMLIQVDKASGRYVTTVFHPETKEILRQYPSETQLAYSRAVRAYLAAQTAA